MSRQQPSIKMPKNVDTVWTRSLKDESQKDLWIMLDEIKKELKRREEV